MLADLVAAAGVTGIGWWTARTWWRQHRAVQAVRAQVRQQGLDRERKAALARAEQVADAALDVAFPLREHAAVWAKLDPWVREDLDELAHQLGEPVHEPTPVAAGQGLTRATLQQVIADATRPGGWRRPFHPGGLVDVRAERAGRVRELQASLGVPVDGVFGPRTIDALEAGGGVHVRTAAGDVEWWTGAEMNR